MSRYVIVLYEAFACLCGAEDVVLRESYKPKTCGKLYNACLRSKPRENTFGCKNFLWKEERVRLLVGSPGASTTPIYSPGSSSTPIYSPGSSSTLIYSLGALTPQSYSPGTSRNAECSNCKHLLDKITIGACYGKEEKQTHGYLVRYDGWLVFQEKNSEQVANIAEEPVMENVKEVDVTTKGCHIYERK
ncbi:hypothetical protein Tco_1143109 [Tanacetum coccineum]